MRYPAAQGGRIHLLHVPSREMITHDVATNLGSTPLIADPRGTGTLELITLSWSILPTTDTPDWQDLRWHLNRLDLSSRTPPLMSWTGYRGTVTRGVFND